MRKSPLVPALAALLVVLSLAAATQSGTSLTGVARPAPATARAQPVDINSATVDELLKVPGMTRAWAVRIVRYRPYRTKLDLEDHGIVSDEIYERIKNYVIAHRYKK